MTPTEAPPRIAGIHHVTAICGDPQQNVDFYAGLLGLRLVKQTVNFDDPGTYHLYYGDGVGTPGTVMTFFAWIAAPPLVVARGRQGSGQIAATSFSIAATSLDYWVDRLAAAAVDFGGPAPRFDDQVLTFQDPDGLPLELVAHRDTRATVAWSRSPVPSAHALRGFRGAALRLEAYEPSAALLRDVLGFTFVGQEGDRFRFRASDGAEAGALDLLHAPGHAPGRMGIGVVHHMAWRSPSEAVQEEWRRILFRAGQEATPILDRKYFRSIYFREPGGVLFEFATDAPGFTIDEPADRLGTHLELPSWLEGRRKRIEARLPEIRLPKAAAGRVLG